MRNLISLLEKMTYNELKDFIDWFEYYHVVSIVSDKYYGQFLKSVRTRRAGIPSGGLPYKGLPLHKKTLRLTTSLQREAFKIAKDLDSSLWKSLFYDPDENTREGAIAWVILNAKKPIRVAARGNIQVKWIPYIKAVLDKEGLPTGKYIRVVAPYLYLRYWQALGDADRKTSRMKSIYIGGATQYNERIRGRYKYFLLASHFHDLIQEHGEMRTRKVKGKRQTYRVRPTGDDNPIVELERAILSCIDMDRVDDIGSLAIDHEKLGELQRELFPDDDEEEADG